MIGLIPVPLIGTTVEPPAALWTMVRLPDLAPMVEGVKVTLMT